MTHPYYDFCFLAKSYNIQKDFDNIYLGVDRTLEVKPQVSLAAYFKDDKEVESFYAWWDQETERGVSIFLVKLKYFGKVDIYGIEQLTPLVYTPNKSDDGTIVTFKAKIVLDPENIDNNVPSAVDITAYIPENSRDNFVQLRGYDLDYDHLNYEIQVPPAFGTLSGTPPSMLYTPDPTFRGTDCFSYVVKDFVSVSKPAIVELIVKDDALPSHVVEYTVRGPIRITGNFHYDAGDGFWKRGFGGFVHPLTDKLRIASYDHKLDPRDDVVEDVTIIKWGDREDYTNYLLDKTLRSFSELSNAGKFMGTKTEGMFEGATIPSLATFVGTYNIKNGRRMFAGAHIDRLGFWPMNNNQYFESMFEGAKIKSISGVGSKKGKFFSKMFKDCTLECIGQLDTRAKISSVDMWVNTPNLTSPINADQVKLQYDGIKFDDLTPCGVSVEKIEKTAGTETCEVPNMGGKCVSHGTYKVVYSNANGATTFQWNILNGVGTISSGQGTDTVVVDVDSGSKETLILECVVTDTVLADSATGSFEHDRTFAFLTLDLPLSYDQISLEDFIRANNPSNKVEVMITNNYMNCSVKTGDLSGLTVLLINNGELQGFSVGRLDTCDVKKGMGLKATSPIAVNNKGWIRGAGGYGGRGRKGDDDFYQVRKEEQRYSGPNTFNSWNEHHDSCKTEIHIDGHDLTRNGVNLSGPYNSPNPALPGKLYRGNYKGCSGNTYHYKVLRVWYEDVTRVGGAGGLGGVGRGYNQQIESGESGEESNPTGGNFGERGGEGGDWGKVGETPVGGSAGYPGCNGVVGGSNITWVNQGNIDGGIA